MDPMFIHKLSVPSESKMVMIIMDGLGGLPREPGGRTELETAWTPNLDRLAQRSALGMTVPAGPGITVGSGPGHLAIFGYDPIKNEIGRGALEALGVDFELRREDVAARGNFCTVDEHGIILDRRAGRLPTEAACRLLALLEGIQVEGVELFLRPVKEHRFAFIMRGAGLTDTLTDTDPQQVGVPPCGVEALQPAAEQAAWIANRFIEEAHIRLAGLQPANMVLLRGFASLPKIPTFQELYGLNPAAIALHGMYRGVARLTGMDILPVGEPTLAGQFAALEEHWNEFDFFYLHVKKTDTCGESGDFDGKVRAIEEVDSFMPRVLELAPDVLFVGGDHSSPAVIRAHSWHPVPALLFGKCVRPDGIAEFGERACLCGSLGILPATHIMPLALANAGRLAKYGA